MKRLKSFTLIELLVVVAIIAVLVAILLPALQRARETARGIDCVSRLHEVSKAIQMYAQDYDGYLPGRGLYTGSGVLWAHYKYRNVLVRVKSGKDIPIYGITRAVQGHCPSRPHIIACWEGVNYWYNRWSCFDGLKLDRIAEPATTSFIFDGPPYDPYPHMNWAERADQLGYIHNNRASIQFLDGHVSLLNEDEVTPNMLVFERW